MKKVIPGFACLLGMLPAATGARAPTLPPTVATDAAEACRASWSARQPASDPAGSQPEASHAKFMRPTAATLCMRGTFERDTLREVWKIADPEAVRTLVITSDGGWSEPAIDLAKLAERHRWLIVIADRCLSSCANYVFLARTAKVVLPQAMLGWHGLPKDPDEFDLAWFEKEKALAPPQWADIDAGTVLMSLRHSKDFLAERGIPPELCRSRPQAGHSPDYVARLNDLARSGAAPLWSYGRRELETRFNVTGILYMWEPRTPEDGTELAMKTSRTNLFYFALSGR